jgi:hypothetical protein
VAVLRRLTITETIGVKKRLRHNLGEEEKKMNLQQIVAELRSERYRIDRAIASLQVGSSSGRRRGRPPKSTVRGGGGITAAGRKRLSEAMKRRWAERRTKSAKVVASAAKPAKKRGGMTAAGRKRLSEMMKKRWAERRKKAS